MSADRLAPPAASSDPLHEPPLAARPRAGVRFWQRDVIDGVTRRFALAFVPAVVLGAIARVARGNADVPMVAIFAVILAGAMTTLSPRLPLRVRMALIVGVFAFVNWCLMYYGRQFAFHGIIMPIGAAFAGLMGGWRWGAWALVVLSGTWLLPLLLLVAGLPSPVDIPWPTQYLRLWFLHTSLSVGLVATIQHVLRFLETSVERGDHLLERVRVEARAVQALAGRIKEAEESERSRLARELHDDFGQRLTALRMKLQLSRPAPGPQAAAIDECVTISEDLLRDVRSFARGLRPPLIDEVGLGPALRALFEQHTGTSVAMTIDGHDAIPRLPPSMEVAAYRVFQEALTNALKHSSATRLSLEMRHDADSVVVALTDDGRGFEPNEADRTSAGRQHLGLVSMRERAAFIGAELEVRSAPGKGTTVRLRVPCAPAPAGQRESPRRPMGHATLRPSHDPS